MKMKKAGKKQVLQKNHVLVLAVVILASAVLAAAFLLTPQKAVQEREQPFVQNNTFTSIEVTPPKEREVVNASRYWLLKALEEYSATNATVLKTSVITYAISLNDKMTLEEIVNETTLDANKIQLMCPATFECRQGTITAKYSVSVVIEASCSAAGCSLRYRTPT